MVPARGMVVRHTLVAVGRSFVFVAVIMTRDRGRRNGLQLLGSVRRPCRPQEEDKHEGGEEGGTTSH